MPQVRQPAYDAVYQVIRAEPPRSKGDYDRAAENARIWRAIEAALDAMGVPAGTVPAHMDDGKVWHRHGQHIPHPHSTEDYARHQRPIDNEVRLT